MRIFLVLKIYIINLNLSYKYTIFLNNNQINKKMFEKIIEFIKIHRFKVILLVIVSSILTLLYVDNTIKINALLEEISKNEKRNQEIKTENEILKSDIIKLQSAERIIHISEEKFGLKKTTKAPKIIEDTKLEPETK